MDGIGCTNSIHPQETLTKPGGRARDTVAHRGSIWHEFTRQQPDTAPQAISRVMIWSSCCWSYAGIRSCFIPTFSEETEVKTWFIIISRCSGTTLTTRRSPSAIMMDSSGAMTVVFPWPIIS